MELIIVIILVALAAGYTIKTFYSKYKTGKSGGSNCGCTSCGLKDRACNASVNIKPDNFLN